SVSNSYLFTGREIDAESGLYYYRARYYDSEVGRFVTQDPIGFEGGINLYAYVGNNPINLIDPTGLGPLQVNVYFIETFAIKEIDMLVLPITSVILQVITNGATV
ncbi:MAG: RHS repeat-associated core domain-containing protein, partial [bacterium]